MLVEFDFRTRCDIRIAAYGLEARNNNPVVGIRLTEVYVDAPDTAPG